MLFGLHTHSALVLLTMFVGDSAHASDQPIHYSRDIKPILAENCYACHGPDENKRKARLRLDTREGAVGELRGGGHAILAGDSGKSVLVERITTTDPDDLMPPPKTGKKLTAEQVVLLRRWIDEGAKFEAHWSYVPPVRKEPPQLKREERIDNPIDAFILRRLESQGLSPTPEADRRTLIRRLSFDLRGLPPTPEEVDAFLADTAPDAYTRLVKRLLASPQYGERMAVYWLDLVRYGDSKGYHSDNPISVWPYRDYVIAAFNDNKPFDVFTIEQLAGDLVPQPTDETRTASGYNRLNLHTEEGGAQPKEYLAKYFADRVRNTSVVWLGASLGCAECHDHKYDPYAAKDFYSFGAFFADLEEVAVGKQVPRLTLPTGEQKAQLQRLDGLLARVRKVLDTQTPSLDAAQTQWEGAVTRPEAGWITLRPSTLLSSGGATLRLDKNDMITAAGERPETDRYVLAAHTEVVGITAIRLEVLPDESAPSKGVGRSENGNIVLSELRLSAAPTEAPGGLRSVQLQNASADFSQHGWPVEAAIDGDPETGWALLPKADQRHEAVFETQADIGGPGGTLLVFDLDQQFGGAHAISRLRISVTAAPRPVRQGGEGGVPKDIKAILAIEPSQRTAEQKQAVAAHFRSIAPELKTARDELAKLSKQREQIQAEVATMLVSTAVEPRPIRILPRGNWLDDSGELVKPDVPSVILAMHTEKPRATRLDLANWMVSRDNPLVARVFVNRLWKLFFGQGLVKTLDDFGTQGAWPTHPELLDWLAVEFYDSGWDVKHMVRLMVTSNAYRQGSTPSRELRERDPANLLLARQARWRIDAEFVRDNALAISGLLVETIGGPSVKPYQPAGYWSFLNFPQREYHHDHGDRQYRRGLYTWWQRTFPHPSLLAFDAPSREECTAERPRSNTPLQSLVLLNDPTYVEAARVFAVRIVREAGQDAGERIRYAMRQALNREPQPAEAKLLTELCAKHMKEYAADPASAEQLLGVGEAPAPTDIAPTELAAWTSVARVILNLHETMTRP
jgi:hypothetical protein